MSAKTPAELKTLFESDTFAFKPPAPGRWGQVYPLRHPSAPVGAYGAEGVRSTFTAKAVAACA